MEKPKLQTVDFEMCDICGKEVRDGDVYEASEGYCCQGSGRTGRMSKHTKGPWVAGGYESHLEIRSLAAYDEPVICVATEREGEDEANARLIAAAPELLEELKYAIHLLKAYSLPKGVREKFEAVIAKAEGREE